MFRTIVKIFKAIDNFLTDCENYTEQRLWNGKFIIDLRFLSVTTFDKITETRKRQQTKILASSGYHVLKKTLSTLSGFFMKFAIIADPVQLIIEGFRLCLKYFAHYLMVLIIGLLVAYGISSLFKNAPAHFVVLLLPLLFINHLTISGFFILVEKKSQGAMTLVLGDMFNQLKQTLPATLFLFFLQNSLAYIASVFFVGFAFMISTIFSAFHIEWRSSFFYVLPMVTTALILLVFVYVFELMVSFAYAFVLHEKKTAFQALQQSYASIHTRPRYSFFFYSLLTLFATCFVCLLSLIAYESGFVVGTILMSHTFLILGFLLRKKYFQNDIADKGVFVTKVSRFAKPIIVIGVFSYISAAALFIQIHPQLIQYLAEQIPKPIAQQAYDIYQQQRYSIRYPNDWSVYRWNDTDLTFSTNDTGTIAGSVKIVITSAPLQQSSYTKLYDASAGFIPNDTNTKNVTIKVANTVINGQDAVKYSFTKADAAQTEFQTHYLIHAGDTIYDIMLVTYSQKRENAYLELFEEVATSFTILQE